MLNRANSRIHLTLCVLILSTLLTAAGAKTIYVDDSAAGANNGTSWADAYVHLQDALADANDAPKPVEVRVAQGVYKPDRGAKQVAGNREATFQLVSGVTLNGGYAGLGAPDPNARDVELYETILSGDLNGDDAEVTFLNRLLKEPTRAENSFHVVTARGTDNSCVLDGFTVMNGNANIWSGFSKGGGTYIDRGTPVIAWCTFARNASFEGGGMYNNNAHPTLINCRFTANVAEYFRPSDVWFAGTGGGMHNNHSNPTLTNCTFEGNYSGGGGGICNDDSSNPALTDCRFIGNLADSGGGVASYYSSNPILLNCTFSENSANWDGGGMSNAFESSPTLTDCTFAGNWAHDDGGGMYNHWYSDPNITSCTFSRNRSERGGGLFNSSNTKANLAKCRVTANEAAYGGGMFNFIANPKLTNCVFSGNSANYGGGIYIDTGNPTVTNCTFAGNRAKYAGDGMGNRAFSGPTLVTNCIFNGSSSQIWQGAIVTYSNVQGGRSGEGNIDVDPLFASPGYWADASDPNITRSPGDPNAVWVEGDYHLKSQAGRWDPASQSWVKDDVTSPCIDAGDPNSPIGEEPEPNGGRINMGAYGGTKEASKSLVPQTIVYIQWLGHSSVKLWAEDCIVYVDPQNLSISPHDATLVLVTHSHSDHYSLSDIARVANAQTHFVAPPTIVAQYGKGQAIGPGQTIESYCARLTGVAAYNANHLKSNNWVGYVIELGGKRIYVAGDTDLIDEMKSLGDIDAAILPAGGTYTMTAAEAAQATQYIRPDLAIPYHWGRNVGTLADAQTFARLARCAVKIMTVGETIGSDNWPVFSPLVAHWTLDETAGDIAHDSAGAYDGTLYSGPAWVPSGKIAGALQLDGVDDYVGTPFVSNPNKGPFSAYAWVKGGAAGQVIVSQTDDTGSGETWLGTEPVSGKFVSGLVPPPAGRTVTPALKSEFVITDGQWHHIGFVWDGSLRRLYVDGAEVAKDAAAVAPLKSSDGGLHLGAGKSLNAGTFWAGLLDDVRIYNVALSPAELEQIAR